MQLDHADTTTDTDQPTCPSHPRRDGNPVWCGDCRDQLATLVWRMPGMRDDLLAAADGGATRPSTGRGGNRIDPSSPSPEFDQADEIDTVLREWATAWCGHVGAALPTDSHGRDLRTTRWAARTLLDTRIGDVWSWHDAEGLGRAVRLLASGARRLLGGTGEIELIPLNAPCPGCEYHSLVQEDGGGRITCKRCPRSMDGDEYDGYIARLLGTCGLVAA